MGALLLFVCKLLVAFVILITIYWLLLRRKTSYRAARIYLLTMPALALACATLNIRILPADAFALLPAGPSSGSFEEITHMDEKRTDRATISVRPVLGPSVSQWADAESGDDFSSENTHTIRDVLPVQAEHRDDQAESSSNIVSPLPAEKIVGMIYWIGLGTLLCWFIWQLLYIAYIRRNATCTVIDGYIVLHSGYVKTPFSFGKTIYVGRGIDGERLSVILSHETAHIVHKHYIDKWLVAFWTTIMWYNPFIWVVARELCMLHEFEADGDVLQGGVSRKMYAYLLVEEVMGGGPYIVNGFSQTLIKNRLIMIKKGTQNRQDRRKVWWAVPLVAVMMAGLTLARAEVDPSNRIRSQADPKHDMQDVSQKMTDKENLSAALSEDSVSIYLKASEMPKFQDGNLNKFREWVQSQLVYPEELKALHEQDTVVVSFVVERDGSVSNIDVCNEPNPLCAKEALRVVSKSPVWTPGVDKGNTVRVRLMVPVYFHLQDNGGMMQAEDLDQEPVYEADVMPKFVGMEFSQWVMEKIQYPEEVYHNGIGGKVIASFVVETNGELSNIEILDSPDQRLSEEVVHVLEKSPHWKPGEIAGQPVRVRKMVPVDFQLPDDGDTLSENGPEAAGGNVLGLSHVVNDAPQANGTLDDINETANQTSGVFVDSQYEYILPANKTTTLVTYPSPREYRVNHYRILDVECRKDETRVLMAVDMPMDQPAGWLIFSSDIYIRDTKTKDRYMLRRVENDIPLNKVIVVEGCGGQSVAFTMIFPPLKKNVRTIDVVDMPNTKVPLPKGNGGGSPAGIVWRNINLSRYLGGDPTVPGEVIR